MLGGLARYAAARGDDPGAPVVWAMPPVGAGVVPFGNGPVEPAQHEVWDDPLGTMDG